MGLKLRDKSIPLSLIHIFSFTSMRNAEENLHSEMNAGDFDATLASCRQLWNDALSKISVSGGTEDEKHIFYTALYHTMIDPRVCSDVNLSLIHI